jgi:hypothetical protein
VATYTPTGGANLLSTGSGLLVLRVEVALLQKCATLYPTATESDKGQIARILRNPAGYANQMLPLVVAIANVAAVGTDSTPLAPTDAELASTVTALWSVTATLGA